MSAATFVNAFEVKPRRNSVTLFEISETDPETTSRTVRFRIAAKVAKELTYKGTPSFSVGSEIYSTGSIEGPISTELDLEGTQVRFGVKLVPRENIDLSAVEQGPERLVNRLVDWYYSESIPKSFRMENVNYVGENVFAKLESKLYQAFKINVNEGLLRAARTFNGITYLILDVDYRVTREQSLWDEMKMYAKNVLNSDIYMPSEHTVRTINEKYGKIGQKPGVIVQGRNQIGEYEVLEFDFTKNPMTPGTAGDMSQLEFSAKVHNNAELIRDRNQPLVRVKVVRGYHFGKINYHVPELLEFKGVPPHIMENKRVSGALANIQKPPPRGRFGQIINFVQGDPFGRTMGFSGDDFVNGFVKVSRSPVLAMSRTVGPIRVKMGSRSFQVSSDSEFLKNILKERFHRVPSIESLWLVYSQEREDDIVDFYHRLRQEASDHGLLLPEKPQLKPASDQTYSEFLKVLRGANETELVITFGSKNDSELYESLKQELLVRHGTLNQHVTYEKTIDRIKEYESQGNNIGIRAIMTNLSMQLCAKLGGAPWAFEEPIYEKGCPVIGLDVNHVDRDADLVRVACAVFDEYGEYLFSEPSDNLTELFQGLSTVLESALHRYEKKFGKPSNLFIVREGLNPTQEQGFLSKPEKGELAIIENVLQRNAIPNYTLVMEKKSTHLRMYKRLTDVRVENPDPGTVVIGPPFSSNEMLMASHEVTQGTVDPIMYKVMKPSNGKMEEIAEALFKLSRHHWNTPKAIRTPAPAFHASQITYLLRKVLKQTPAHRRVLDRPFYL